MKVRVKEQLDADGNPPFMGEVLKPVESREVKTRHSNAPHVPSVEFRDNVSLLIAFGLKQEQVSKVLGIAKNTLRKYYKHEIENGSDVLNARVAKQLFEKAMAGDTVSILFWLKCRAGWSEKNVQEHVGAVPVQLIETKYVKKPTKKT